MKINRNSVSRPHATGTLARALSLATLLLGCALPVGAQVYWDGNVSTAWDTATANWNAADSGGSATTFSSDTDVTFGVTSPTTQIVVVDSAGVNTGLFRITSGTNWAFSGGDITASTDESTHIIEVASTFTDTALNLEHRGKIGFKSAVAISADVTLTSATAKTSVWRGPFYSFTLASVNTLTLAGNAVLDANKIPSRRDNDGTIVINDNAVLKGAFFGRDNNGGFALRPIDLNGGALYAKQLTGAGGGVAISWSGGVIRPTDADGLTYGTNNEGVINTITLDGAGGGTFDGRDYDNANSSITIDDEIAELGGSYGVSMTGGGSLELKGVNSYTGNTTVSAGSLVVSGDGSINNSSGVSVATGATFTNTSTVAFSKALTLAEGALVSGNGAFKPTSVTLTANIGDGFNTFAFGSTALTKAGKLELNLTDIADGAYTILSGSALSGAFGTMTIGGAPLKSLGSGNFSGVVGGKHYTFTNSSNLLTVAIPKPNN